MFGGRGKSSFFQPHELEAIGYKLVMYPISLLGVSIQAMQVIYLTKSYFSFKFLWKCIKKQLGLKNGLKYNDDVLLFFQADLEENGLWLIENVIKNHYCNYAIAKLYMEISPLFLSFQYILENRSAIKNLKLILFLLVANFILVCGCSFFT